MPPDLDDLGPLIENGNEVRSLRKSIIDAPRDIHLLVSITRRMLEGNLWLDRFDAVEGKRYTYEPSQFRTFVEEDLLKGTGVDSESLRILLKPHSDVATPFESLWGNPRGGNNNPHGCKGKPEGEGINPNNIRIDSTPSRDRSQEPPAGTSFAYGIRRLHRAAEGKDKRCTLPPDKVAGLIEEVRQGKKSTNAAMIEAGLRNKFVSIPLEPRAAAEALIRHLGLEDLTTLVVRLQEILKEQGGCT